MKWARGFVAAGILLASSAGQAQVLQQYLPEVAAPAIGQAGAAIAPDVSATPRGAVEILPGTTVTTRPHPEYDPRAVHVGSFYIRPQLTESAGYNSNLFADRSGRGAFLINTAAGVSFASDFANRGIAGGVVLNNTIYPTLNDQSFTNVTANLGGFYNIGRDQLRLEYTHANLHIARGSIDAGNFDRPIPFEYDTIHASYLVPFARLSFEPSIDLSNFRFQNGTFNGQQVLQTINNRNVGQATLTTRYELSPLRSLVVVARGIAQEFYDPQPLPARNSKSGEILAGVDFNLNALFRVRGLIGYEVRTFSNSLYQTRSAPVFNADVIWTPTELTSVTTSVNRSIEDGLATVTNGFTYTSAKISVDHELRRNILLNGHAQAQLAEFAGNQGTTDIYSVGATATWRLNRNLSLVGRYDFANRQASETQGNSYSQNIVLLGFGLRL